MPRISKSHTTDFFEKQFEGLEKNIQKIAARKIRLFEDSPAYPGLHTHKLKGALDQLWAFYITEKYRVLFKFLKDNEVIYYDIDTHDIYK